MPKICKFTLNKVQAYQVPIYNRRVPNAKKCLAKGR